MRIKLDTEICGHCLFKDNKLSLMINSDDDQGTMTCTVCGDTCTETSIDQEIKMRKIEIENSERSIRELLTIFRSQFHEV